VSAERIERLRGLLDEPFLVTAPVNVRYLTGLASSNAAVLVERERVRLFTDFRYAERARSVEGVEVVETTRALTTSLAELLPGRVAFEADHVTYAGWETLSRGGRELVPRTGVVDGLRAVKDAAELDAIRRAAAVTDRAYDVLAAERFVGRSERDLAWRMEQLLHEEGADGLAFPVIVATGPNGARPHAVPGDRVVEPGHTVVVDAGAVLDGYASDCTRTFAAGPLPERLDDAYETCLRAQLAGLELVRAGASGRETDARVRALVDATEFRGTFRHGLGHGVGLLVHESPSLRQEEDDRLEPGNVVTVEPGIYLEGEGGIRIEDLVVVTEDGCEVLSSFTKDLVTVS
jgi:Xaa-Pro aminopeptidase